MQDQYQLRTFEGKGILHDHLKKIREASELFLSALKGFHRDIGISIRSFPENIRVEFKEEAKILDIPPLFHGGDFANLSEAMLRAEDAIDGEIKISFPWIVNQEGRKKILEEIELIHRNLLLVADSAMQVHDLIQKATLQFDMFNAKNQEVNYKEADIIFNRDAMNIAMQTARAISERAIRFDIDLVAKKESI
ncbi:MAG: hypothetical protein KBC17_02620 [Candidatus Pacebacteria bacterium]|nr:hypothetical protein [Candidatus Paceibacterota bacterium]